MVQVFVTCRPLLQTLTPFVLFLSIVTVNVTSKLVCIRQKILTRQPNIESLSMMGRKLPKTFQH